MPVRCLRSSIVASLLTLSNAALAQSPPVSAGSSAAAETLFQEARTLVEKKEYAEACPKFAESQRLDPGIGTLMNLGDCYEKSGKIASAWATYREAVAEANRTGQKQRERDALVLAARVEPKLSRLLVRVPAPTSGYPGVQIKRDGQVVDRAQWGILIPTDPGGHTVSAEAPGHAPWSTKIELAEASNKELEVPPLEALPEAPSPEEVDRGATQRLVGFVVGGVGIASLVTGGVFGLVAMNLRSSARDLGCDDNACSNASAKDKNDSALTAANISTLLFAGGAIVTAAGAIIVLTAPGRGPAAAPAARAATRQGPSAPGRGPWLGAGVRGQRVVLEGGF
jgi:hypothetical protein